MNTSVHARLASFISVWLLFALAVNVQADEPLPSWKDGPTKQTIIEYVKKVTTPGSADFVPAAERIVTTDNDGTLWSEQPVYFQLLFALDRIKALSKDNPQWKEIEPYKSVLNGDMKKLSAGGMDALMKIIAETHTGMSEQEFAQIAADWLANAKHPGTGKTYTDMVYQPMLELMDYLRANDFKVFIVSGGGIGFLRVFAEDVYGVPPEQVVGSTIEAKYVMNDGVPAVIRQPALSLIDDKEGKPVGISRHIGRRPLIAIGNSDGDLQMLQYTTIARNETDTTPRLGVIIHHTDAEREYAYDRKSHIGKLDAALDEASQRGWLVVDMKEDWSQIYP
ncbi:HAD family phosphatase [Gilvimarinus sp. DA14]|uniref:HAD family hydrolase n=1 Tax=Gilvimarinus sp. DA14 TaxID=2956798 RepID=UPI0020B7C420|nr:HAD family hydrolase [Gilvimarinus sp. DA14]UTF58595.1 haloacid dehalogenase-like hydrolase [Gilvimarinus sp. DA14]